MFSGKKKDWLTWSKKFEAKAMQKGYYGLLTGKKTIPETAEDEEESDESKELKELNAKGYSKLILSMNTNEKAGEVAFNLVRKSKKKDEGGDLRVAWENLKRKYEPKTAPSLIAAKNEFIKMKLNKNKDPDEFITAMEFLKERLRDLGKEMTEKDLIIRILNSLPDGYEIEVAQLEKDLTSGKDGTIEDVREVLELRYARSGSKNEYEN